MELISVSITEKAVPSFAYLICEDNGKFFVPIFDADNTVVGFEPVDYKTSFIVVNEEQRREIKKGDQGLFAYYTGNSTLIADAEELVIQLLKHAKEQNMHEGYLRSFEAFAKKYDVFTTYLEEYYKHYGDSGEMVRLLAHAATDNTDYFAKNWAIKTWTRIQKQHPKLSSTISLNRTREGDIRASFEERDSVKLPECVKWSDTTTYENLLSQYLYQQNQNFLAQPTVQQHVSQEILIESELLFLPFSVKKRTFFTWPKSKVKRGFIENRDRVLAQPTKAFVMSQTDNPDSLILSTNRKEQEYANR